MEDTVAAACGETTFPWDEEIAKGPGFVLKSLSPTPLPPTFNTSCQDFLVLAPSISPAQVDVRTCDWLQTAEVASEGAGSCAGSG